MADLLPPDSGEGGHDSETDEVPEGECGDCGQKFNEPDEDMGVVQKHVAQSQPDEFFLLLLLISTSGLSPPSAVKPLNFHETCFPLPGCS